LKFARKKMFLSQEATAKELGVSFSSLNRWENGKFESNYAAQKAFRDFCVKEKYSENGAKFARQTGIDMIYCLYGMYKMQIRKSSKKWTQGRR
jgi:transcriptional regulator with XRE-family HTH domain